MKITICGYGSIGSYVEDVFGPSNEITLYDPPKGLGQAIDLKEADFVFICVPTPSKFDGKCDISIVEQLIGEAQPRRAIVCHSTVAVGTTERLIHSYGKPLVYVPEYAGELPDHPYRRIENRDFRIYGGYEPQASYVRSLFEAIPGQRAQHFIVPPTVAEIVKYMENAFLALKVGFCNEFFDLAEAFGVDYEMVRDLWLQDRRINPSHTVVTTERGYGGKCFPKDVAAVCATSREVGVPAEIMEALQRANARHRGSFLEKEPVGIGAQEVG